MKRWRFTEDQIIGVLKEHGLGVKTGDLCRKRGISEATFYNWKSRFGGTDVSEAKRRKALEEENSKLKRLLADAMLDNAALKDRLSKRMACPVCKRFMEAHLESLRHRIRPVGIATAKLEIRAIRSS